MEGIEVVDFSGTNEFNIRFMANSAKARQRISDTVQEQQSVWADQVPPTQLVG